MRNRLVYNLLRIISVAPSRIELLSKVPETFVLSIKLRGHGIEWPQIYEKASTEGYHPIYPSTSTLTYQGLYKANGLN